MNFPKPLYKYLTRNKDGVADLVTKARLMGKLNQEFLSLLPSPVNLHVQLAYIEGSKLQVIADSPAWASKFRLMTSHLLPTLKKNIQYFQYLKEIKVITRPDYLASPVERPSQKRAISEHGKDCLQGMAESLENKPLQDALLRLADNYKKNK